MRRAQHQAGRDEHAREFISTARQIVQQYAVDEHETLRLWLSCTLPARRSVWVLGSDSEARLLGQRERSMHASDLESVLFGHSTQLDHKRARPLGVERASVVGVPARPKARGGCWRIRAAFAAHGGLCRGLKLETRAKCAAQQQRSSSARLQLGRSVACSSSRAAASCSVGASYRGRGPSWSGAPACS